MYLNGLVHRSEVVIHDADGVVSVAARRQRAQVFLGASRDVGHLVHERGAFRDVPIIRIFLLPFGTSLRRVRHVAVPLRARVCSRALGPTPLSRPGAVSSRRPRDSLQCLTFISANP